VINNAHEHLISEPAYLDEVCLVMSKIVVINFDFRLLHDNVSKHEFVLLSGSDKLSEFTEGLVRHWNGHVIEVIDHSLHHLFKLKSFGLDTVKRVVAIIPCQMSNISFNTLVVFTRRQA
jgi:hypothetical protein